MKRRRIPWAILLPLLSLVSWVCLVTIPISLDDMLLREDPEQSEKMLSDLKTLHDPTESQVFVFAASIDRGPAHYWINGIDLPANFVELILDRASKMWPDTWHPEGFTVFSWRAITFPIYSLPFWWFAGFGLDAMLKRRHPRRWVLLLGSALFLVFLALAVLNAGSSHPVEEPEVSLPITVGVWLWTLLFGCFVVASVGRLRSWRKSRHAIEPVPERPEDESEAVPAPRV